MVRGLESDPWSPCSYSFRRPEGNSSNNRVPTLYYSCNDVCMYFSISLLYTSFLIKTGSPFSSLPWFFHIVNSTYFLTGSVDSFPSTSNPRLCSFPNRSCT